MGVVESVTSSVSSSDLVAHLYRRAGFGALPDELRSATAAGYGATVSALVAGLTSPMRALVRLLRRRSARRSRKPSSKAWTLRHGATSSASAAPGIRRPHGLVAEPNAGNVESAQGEADLPPSHPFPHGDIEGPLPRLHVRAEPDLPYAGQWRLHHAHAGRRPGPSDADLARRQLQQGLEPERELRPRAHGALHDGDRHLYPGRRARRLLLLHRLAPRPEDRSVRHRGTSSTAPLRRTFSA